MKIIVYTCLTSNLKCPLYEPENYDPDIEYYCFSDKKTVDSKVYKTLPLPYTLQDNRRNSRFPKINSHLVFPNADITIWHDITYQVKNINNLLDSLGDDYFFATSKHHCRNSVKDETIACIKQRKDNNTLLLNQYASYIKDGFEDNGLYENFCLVRKKCDKAVVLNELWWKEYSKWSCRDQISLPYVFWKLNDHPTIIPGNRFVSDFFNRKVCE